MGDNKIKYDFAFLNKISGGDQAFILEMVKTFKEMAPEFIDNSRVYLDAKNYELLSKEAHKFAPGVGFLGIKELEADLNLLEDYAKNGKNIEAIPDLLNTAITKVESIVEIFNKEFNLED